MNNSAGRQPHILVVEDDKNLGFLLQENIRAKGFSITLESTGQKGLQLVERGDFDLCILDIMLPEVDGYNLAISLKQRHPSKPFLFLTARTLEHDKLHGFEIGAEDYIVKPFSFKELFYRINVIIRRTFAFEANNLAATEQVIKLGNITFNTFQRTLTINGQARKLSQREGGILQKLLQHAGKYITRSEILKCVWGNDDYFTAKSMDVYMTRIRKILKEDPSIEIENLYGTGYRIIAHEAASL